MDMPELIRIELDVPADTVPMMQGFAALARLRADVGEQNASEWVTPTEAAGILGVKVNTVYEMVKDGRLVSKKIGTRRYRISRESLNAD